MTVASPALDLRAAYEHAEASRIAIAAELATVRQTLRRERALRTHPVLTDDLLEFIHGETDEDYAANANALVAALSRPRVNVQGPSAQAETSPAEVRRLCA